MLEKDVISADFGKKTDRGLFVLETNGDGPNGPQHFLIKTFKFIARVSFDEILGMM